MTPLLERIDAAIAEAAPAAALALLRQFYAARPTLATASGVIEKVGQLIGGLPFRGGASQNLFG